MAKSPLYVRETKDAFEYLLEEYCSESPDIIESIAQIETPDNYEDLKISIADEEKAVASFLNTPCPCFRTCLGKKFMLKNSFQHIPGIGAKTERQLLNDLIEEIAGDLFDQFG